MAGSINQHLALIRHLLAVRLGAPEWTQPAILPNGDRIKARRVGSSYEYWVLVPADETASQLTRLLPPPVEELATRHYPRLLQTWPADQPGP